MTSEDVRKKFLEFFGKKGHTVVPSSSLLPSDPSVLITTAGMQQFKPYYTGEKDPLKDIHSNLGRPLGSKNTASIQKSFRTSDIDEVGDETHLTFFEMLGNFSFGGYFKKEAIEWSHEFITKELELPIDYVSVFKGEKDIPLDEESETIWKSLGVARVRRFGREDNFWGPTGSEGPCGPTTEIYIKGVEVWNLVFNEYYSDSNGKLTELETPGVDTGMGLERLMTVIQSEPSIFETDLFKPLYNLLGDNYSIETKRIIVDHLRGSVFLIVDGIQPSNKDRGYILRRVLRRAISHIANKERIVSTPLGRGTPKELNERVANIIKLITNTVIEKYGSWYEELRDKNELVDTVIKHEIGKSLDLLKSSTELRKVVELYKSSKNKEIPGAVAFNLFSTLGITIDYIRDEAERNRLKVNEKEFEDERKKHQEISRAGAKKKFGGHGLLLDTGEIKAGSEEELKKVLRLHTATHLLQAALRQILGNEVEQRGSDVNAERTRFDFTFPRKMTPEEIKQVEDLINNAVKKDLPVHKVELPLEEAEKTGALHFFNAKYPPRVKIYYIGNTLEGAFSKEFCNGPHVESIGEIGGIVIKKEEAVSAGVRRIRAELAVTGSS